MADQLSVDARKQLERFSRQYLQLQVELDYPSEVHLRQEAIQSELYRRLFQDGALKYAPPQRYQLRVLKELLRRIEESIQDWEEDGISDDLMICLSSLLSSSLPSEETSAQVKSYVTYTFPSLSHTRLSEGGPSDLPATHEETVDRGPPTITLLETTNLLAASGTTGLRTWEASLHLASYLISYPSLIQHQSILDLGAGTGLLSILCAKYLGATHVLSTDGSDDVLSTLSTNFYLNGLQDSSRIVPKELRWGYPLLGSEEPAWNGGRRVDLVLGADLTYDSTNHPALVATFGELFDLYGEVKILIAATVRNEETFEIFGRACEGAGLGLRQVEWEHVSGQEQMGPFYFYDGDVAPTRLMFVTRRKDSA